MRTTHKACIHMVVCVRVSDNNFEEAMEQLEMEMWADMHLNEPRHILSFSLCVACCLCVGGELSEQLKQVHENIQRYEEAKRAEKEIAEGGGRRRGGR